MHLLQACMLSRQQRSTLQYKRTSRDLRCQLTGSLLKAWQPRILTPAHRRGGSRTGRLPTCNEGREAITTPPTACRQFPFSITMPRCRPKSAGEASACSVWGAGRAPGGGPAASWACSAASADVGGRPSAGSASAVTLALGASGARRATAPPSICDVSACADARDASGFLDGFAGLGEKQPWTTRQPVCQLQAPAAEACKSPPCARARQAAGLADAAVLKFDSQDAVAGRTQPGQSRKGLSSMTAAFIGFWQAASETVGEFTVHHLPRT